MRLTNAYLRAAMIARTLVAGLALTVPPILHAQNVAEVQVAPPSVTIKVGERTGLLATAFDRIGNVIPTVRVIWSSNNVQVARVDRSEERRVGKSVDLGGRRIIKKKKKKEKRQCKDVLYKIHT